MDEKDRQYHEVANIFPLMSAEEYEALKVDIATNGLLEPVWLHPDDHSIIDGRNRHKACVDLGRDPKFRYWDKQGSLVSFVVSLNLKRRHLNAMQKAAVAVDILPILEAEAKQRQVEAITRGNKTRHEDPPPIVQNFEQLAKDEKPKPAPKSVDQAASVVGTNRQYVSDMKRYKEEAPEVYQKAKEGKVNGSQAKAIADLPAEKRKEVIERIDAGEELTASKIKTEHTKEERRNRSQDLPTIDGEKVYNVIYADPPWEYSNTGVHGAAEHHYNTMPIDKIETLLSDIGLNVDKNAVLFLWVTNPILAEGFHIVEKWGFKYKTNMVWVKTELKKPGSGFYVRGRHELLFIATRGSFTPLDEHISPPIGSVVEHPILEHSRKPECFYQVIERLYPGCNYIELFARSSRLGWDTWGNETEKFVRSTENAE